MPTYAAHCHTACQLRLGRGTGRWMVRDHGCQDRERRLRREASGSRLRSLAGSTSQPSAAKDRQDRRAGIGGVSKEGGRALPHVRRKRTRRDSPATTSDQRNAGVNTRGMVAPAPGTRLGRPCRHGVWAIRTVRWGRAPVLPCTGRANPVAPERGAAAVQNHRRREMPAPVLSRSAGSGRSWSACRSRGTSSSSRPSGGASRRALLAAGRRTSHLGPGGRHATGRRRGLRDSRSGTRPSGTHRRSS